MASNSIREIRPYLLKVLDEIFKNPPRPPKFISKEFPSVALLVDATTVRCSVPVGDFDDARQLFDGHHNSYSMKIEVAVSAWPPFKALFVSESVPGGVHDVTLFRSGKHRYVEYLKKTEEEKLGNSVCNQNDSWSIMADKGYQGHFIDINVITPIKRIHKANKTLNEKEFQRSESESVYSLSSTQPSSLSSTQPSSLSSTQPSSLSSQPSFMSLSVSPLLSFPSASSSSSISPPADNLFIVPASVATTSTQSETLFTKAGMSVMTAKEVEIFNKKVAKHRIPVEWFFGRMKRLWLRMSEKYTGPREDFPADAKIACWLTNIVIDNNSLEADDGIFYRKVSEFSNKKETERKLIQEINARASMERKIIRKASK
ncbi:uncharacterized protein MONOS_9377 [Monocercomonoides exilis]|uniref:uncharacterized protein n=1 Tax=Monocercomonoides exilis TaxID=2049356 RepID=UPI0035598CA9|nr:hypothetical protein MONOS_9377 [Monocercomonoides exilis]|eukprot:MONOS_9377.1-p1 / transcript=MONOS_9377.1 / gene=MONOS_9377 / organism=Monocercomonoides_exilis_PA203 / gene_product=unspecified product / transcript_product=unspecified product / location=Mono_scaffold00385:20189-21304(-) / protein_length=371 / sequence_SO=supercontig / SO=protein_coding / is_pseudo=false